MTFQMDEILCVSLFSIKILLKFVPMQGLQVSNGSGKCMVLNSAKPLPESLMMKLADTMFQ